MLVRAFRLTDKLSNAFLKLSVYLTYLLVERIVGLRQALETTATTIGETAQDVARTANRSRQRSEQRIQAVMARSESRALQLQQEVQVIEDPLLARNRSLSAIAVILLLALIGVLIWSPTGEGTGNFGSSGFGVIPTNPGSGNPEISAPSPVPSISATSPILPTIAGTLVFTLRQNGQDDLWALPAGSSQPIRLTDSPTDDRDPAWSPDGTRIAFSSRREGPWDLYILNVQSGQITQVTHTVGYEGSPTWSPDGAFIAYEGYNEGSGSIDLYIISTTTDGACASPCQLTLSPFPDLEPAWIPSGNGREIAYVGYRNNNREILILNLDGQPEAEARNLTNTPTINENTPQWSPDGSRVVYTAVVDGVQGIYVKSINDPGSGRLIGRGQMATWNPSDNASVFYVTSNGSALYLGQVDNFGAGAPAIAFQGSISDLDWANAIINIQGYPLQTASLYAEDMNNTGIVQLRPLPNVRGRDQVVLSDAVNDSFEAMRRRVVERIGYDLLGTLESAFWSMDQRPEPGGQEDENWHYTGRAFSLPRELVQVGNPTPIVVIREDTELGTTWRVMARVTEDAQNGTLGEPLRDIPWDFAARTAGDPAAFEAGGRLMTSVPGGYYVDLTRLFNDFGWERTFADRSWRTNYAGLLFWQFEKRESLGWFDAMLQIYPRQEVEAFILGATPRPPTPIPTFTIEPTAVPGGDRPRTATPIPPDAGSN